MGRSKWMKLLVLVVATMAINGGTPSSAAGVGNRSATINEVVMTPTGFQVTYTAAVQEIKEWRYANSQGLTAFAATCTASVVNGDVFFGETRLFCALRDPATVNDWYGFKEFMWQTNTWSTNTGTVQLYEADWVFCIYVMYEGLLPPHYMHMAPEVCVPLSDRNSGAVAPGLT